MCTSNFEKVVGVLKVVFTFISNIYHILEIPLSRAE